MSEDFKYIITLVHGTFARSAKWTRAGSLFRKYLTDNLEGAVKFNTFAWSAYHTQSARLAASSRLRKKLLKQYEQFPEARHFIVGHSHGGNIALYAIEREEEHQKLDGIICLNTPFICATRRLTQNTIYLILRLLCISLIIMIFYGFFVFALAALIDWYYGQGGLVGIQVNSNISGEYWYLLPLFPAILVLIIWYIWERTEKIDKWTQNKRDNLLEITQLPTITNIKIFCISNANDEVYGGFSFLENLANLPFIMLHSFFIYLIPIFFVGFGAHFIFFGDNDIQYIIQDSVYLENIHVIIPISILALLFIIAVILFFIALYALYLTIAGIFMNFILRVLPIGLSPTSFYDSLFVRISFTLVPVKAALTEFHDLALKPRFLNHSAPYQEKPVLELIVKSILQRQKHQMVSHG